MVAYIQNPVHFPTLFIQYVLQSQLSGTGLRLRLLYRWQASSAQRKVAFPVARLHVQVLGLGFINQVR